MKSEKQTILMVGALAIHASDGIGGIHYACQSLLDSPLSEKVNWLLINSTVPLSIQKSVLRRTLFAASRVIRLLYLLIAHPRVDTVFIFGNYELTSFLEKGTMVLLGHAFRKRTVLSLRTEIRPHAYDRWFTPFRRWALGSADRVICQSRLAAQKLVELTGCDPDKLVVIMNWIDYRKYERPERPAVPQDRADQPTKFVFVGHLTANKAPDVLLAAARLLKERGVPFHLVFCGQGPLYEQLQRDIQAFDLGAQVDLRGWVVGDALIQALWAADVFVLPTHSEGMPNALLEAMAAGLPAITTPVSSIPEIISEGENGLLVLPGDAVSLANAMEQLSRSPELRATMSANNRARIRQNHTIDESWVRIADLLAVR